MAHVLVLAAAAALYPALLAGVVLILTRPHPIRQLAGFYTGGLAISLTAGFLVLFALDGSGALERSGSAHAIGPTVDLLAGVLSLAVAARLWARRAHPPRRTSDGHESKLSRILARGSLPVAIGAGVVLNLPGVWYLAALEYIAQGHYDASQEVLMVGAFNVVMFTLVEAPLIWYVVDPASAQRAVVGFDGWFHANTRRIGAAVAASVGAYLVVKGIVQS